MCCHIQQTTFHRPQPNRNRVSTYPHRGLHRWHIFPDRTRNCTRHRSSRAYTASHTSRRSHTCRHTSRTDARWQRQVACDRKSGQGDASPCSPTLLGSILRRYLALPARHCLYFYNYSWEVTLPAKLNCRTFVLFWLASTSASSGRLDTKIHAFGANMAAAEGARREAGSRDMRARRRSLSWCRGRRILNCIIVWWGFSRQLG